MLLFLLLLLMLMVVVLLLSLLSLLLLLSLLSKWLMLVLGWWCWGWCSWCWCWCCWYWCRWCCCCCRCWSGCWWSWCWCWFCWCWYCLLLLILKLRSFRKCSSCLRPPKTSLFEAFPLGRNRTTVILGLQAPSLSFAFSLILYTTMVGHGKPWAWLAMLQTATWYVLSHFPSLLMPEVSMSTYHASLSVVRRAGGGVRSVSAPSAVSGSSDCATLGRDIVLSSGCQKLGSNGTVTAVIMGQSILFIYICCLILSHRK